MLEDVIIKRYIKGKYKWSNIADCIGWFRERRGYRIPKKYIVPFMQGIYNNFGAVWEKELMYLEGVSWAESLYDIYNSKVGYEADFANDIDAEVKCKDGRTVQVVYDPGTGRFLCMGEMDNASK